MALTAKNDAWPNLDWYFLYTEVNSALPDVRRVSSSSICWYRKNPHLLKRIFFLNIEKGGKSLQNFLNRQNLKLK